MDSLFLLIKIEQHLQQLQLLQKEVLSFNEGCHFCGFRPSWMYQLTSKKKIPFYKPNGKKIFFRHSELEVWLLSNKISVKKKRTSASHTNKKRRATS